MRSLPLDFVDRDFGRVAQLLAGCGQDLVATVRQDHQRTAEPWSLRVAEVSNGHGKQVWKAETGVGSAFRGVDATNQLFWGGGDRLVFPWERDGWTHFYAVPAGGGSAELLTPGKFEVETVSLSPGPVRFLASAFDA